MKKILSMILAIIILIPTVTADAADVPSFRVIAGSMVEVDKVYDTSDGHTYVYVSLDYNKEFVKPYINLLQKKNLKLIDYTRRSSKNEIDFWVKSTYHKWLFDCRGFCVTFSLKDGVNEAGKKYKRYFIEVPNELTYDEE